MAVGLTFSEYVEALRTYFKDKSEYNILLTFKEENYDEELELYVKMAISQINMIPPGFLNQYNEESIVNFPFASLVIMEATWFALESNNIVQARNDLPYSNGGVTIQVEDRNRYMPAISVLWNNLIQSRSLYSTYKKSQNISSILGGSRGCGSPSPYYDIYRSKYIYY